MQDKENFTVLCDNLKSLGVGRRTQAQVFSILAAILHLGNITFFHDANLPEGSPVSIKSREPLDIAASLLQIPPTSLENALIYMSKLVGGDLCSLILTAEGAALQRDRLAQTLYSLTFSWLIEHINSRLCKPDEEVDAFVAIADFPWIRPPPAGKSTAAFDILFSNYAIERLIQFANNQHFDSLQTLIDDGYEGRVEEYNDNQLTIDLFVGTQRMTGLWTLLDQGLHKPTNPELSLASDIALQLDTGLKTNVHYQASSHSSSDAQTQSRVSFGIKHFGTDVEYDLEGFIESDAIMSDFVALFRPNDGTSDDSSSQESSFIQNLFSKSNGIRTLRSGKGRVLGATKGQRPLRRPSVKRKAGAASKVPEAGESQFSTAAESVNDLIACFEGTRFWTIYTVSPTESNLATFNVPDLAAQKQICDLDVGTGVSFTDFAAKFAPLLATLGASRATSDPREIVKSFIQTQYWPTREVFVGSAKLYLSVGKWRWLADELKRIETGSTQIKNDVNVDWSHLNRDSFIDEHSEGIYRLYRCWITV
jgi:chitin synthase